jgi:hypothetical protein
MSLVLGSPDNTPAQTTLHLLPFHIAHDGPAPVRTFFRARPANARFPGQKGAALIDEGCETAKADKDMGDGTTPTAELAALSVDDSRRLTASFRGREMQGLRVTLPAGFAGVVFRPPPAAVSSVSSPSTSAVPTKKLDVSRAKKDAAAAKARAKRAWGRAHHTGAAGE